MCDSDEVFELFKDKTFAYKEGFIMAGANVENPYNFFDNYIMHYDWSNGFQRGLQACKCPRTK